jgi:hypothetical protein
LKRLLAADLGFGGIVAGRLGVGFRHEFSLLGFAVPPTTLVINLRFSVDPN